MGNSESVTTSTTVITANESIDTTEKAMVYVKDLDMFVTVQLLEYTPAVLSLENPAKKMGIHTDGKKVKLQISYIMYLYLYGLSKKTNELCFY